MKIEPIIEARRRQPFSPFILKTVGGREYVVPHPEMIGTHPEGRHITLFDERVVPIVLDLAMIESLHIVKSDEKGAA
ncbi:MAG: hypothetical protein RLN60_00890 [Phycisphaerales bacterium]